MAISFQCGQCGQTYQASEELAGRWTRCKKCGSDVPIPGGKKAPARGAPAFDLGDEPPPRTKTALLDDDELPPPPRAGFKPTSPRPKESASRPKGGDDTLTRYGLTMFILGVGSFLLPLVGRQFVILSALPPAVQPVVGVLLAVAGAVCLLIGQEMRQAVAVLAVGGVILVILVVVNVATHRKPAEPPALAEANPPPAKPAAPAFPKARPARPKFPAPKAPPVPRPAEPEVAVAEPALEPTHPAEAAEQPRITLSNAQAMRPQGPFGSPRPGTSFRVDYRVDGPTLPNGPLVWVIRGRRKVAYQTIAHLESQGTLSGTVRTMSEADGPFQTSVAVKAPGPLGRAGEPLSETVAVQWVGQPAPAVARPGPPLDRGFAPPPTGPTPTVGTLDALLTDLKSPDSGRRRGAAQRLAHVPPEAARRAEVLPTLQALLADPDDFTRQFSVESLAAWGGTDAVPMLIPMVEDRAFAVRWTAIEALGRLKDPRAAEPIAGRLKEDGIKAVPALKAIGPPAERAVLAALKHPEWTVRCDACKILAEIGGKASIPPLRAAARNTRDALVSMEAQKALQAIDSRR